MKIKYISKFGDFEYILFPGKQNYEALHYGLIEVFLQYSISTCIWEKGANTSSNTDETNLVEHTLIKEEKIWTFTFCLFNRVADFPCIGPWSKHLPLSINFLFRVGKINLFCVASLDLLNTGFHATLVRVWPANTDLYFGSFWAHRFILIISRCRPSPRWSKAAAAAPQQDHSTSILLCIGIVGKILNIFKPKNTSLSPSCLQKLFHLKYPIVLLLSVGKAGVGGVYCVTLWGGE